MPVVPETIRRDTCTFCGGNGRLIGGRSAAPEGQQGKLFVCANCVEEAAAILLSRDVADPTAKGASAFSQGFVRYVNRGRTAPFTLDPIEGVEPTSPRRKTLDVKLLGPHHEEADPGEPGTERNLAGTARVVPYGHRGHGGRHRRSVEGSPTGSS